MPVIRWLSLLVLLVLAGACSDGIAAPPIGYTHAAAAFTCGPADGPAVMIFLSPNPVESPQATPPVVRIFIGQAVEEISGKVWSVDGTSSATASFQSEGNTLENPTSGYVITSSVSADTTVDGTVNLTFPTGGHIVGGFHARWISRAGSPCG
jgi:hypothetical protein